MKKPTSADEAATILAKYRGQFPQEGYEQLSDEIATIIKTYDPDKKNLGFQVAFMIIALELAGTCGVRIACDVAVQEDRDLKEWLDHMLGTVRAGVKSTFIKASIAQFFVNIDSLLGEKK